MPAKKSNSPPLDHWGYDLLLEKINGHSTHLTEIKNDIREIKLVLLEPDRGLVGRIKTLETSRQNSQKFFWIVVTSLVGLALSGAVWIYILK